MDLSSQRKLVVGFLHRCYKYAWQRKSVSNDLLFIDHERLAMRAILALDRNFFD